MKKTWELPVICVQQFEANEYVAACGDSGVIYNFECNAGEKKKHYAVKDANGDVATISGMYLNGSWYYYHPCGAVDISIIVCPNNHLNIFIILCLRIIKMISKQKAGI